MLTPAGVRAVVWWLPGKDLSVQSSCQAGFYGLMPINIRSMTFCSQPAIRYFFSAGARSVGCNWGNPQGTLQGRQNLMFRCLQWAFIGTPGGIAMTTTAKFFSNFGNVDIAF